MFREGLAKDGTLMVERIAIRKPIWDGRCVGIANFRACRSDLIEVKLLYRLKKSNNKPLAREIFRMASTKVLEYATQNTGGIILHIVPLADFTMV